MQGVSWFVCRLHRPIISLLGAPAAFTGIRGGITTGLKAGGFVFCWGARRRGRC